MEDDKHQHGCGCARTQERRSPAEPTHIGAGVYGVGKYHLGDQALHGCGADLLGARLVAHARRVRLVQVRRVEREVAARTSTASDAAACYVVRVGSRLHVVVEAHRHATDARLELL